MKKFTNEEEIEAKENFQEFLFYIDDTLESFVGKARTAGYTLDYSLKSLDDLEEYIAKIDSSSQDEVLDPAAQYLGEVVKENFSGKWELSLDMKENSLYYGQPVIIGHSDEGIQFAPYDVVNSFSLRKKKEC